MFAVLPTGFGESLCSCSPVALYKILKKEAGHSIVMVVSPLLAIMKDQLDSICIGCC